MRSIDFVLAFPQADVQTDIYLKVPKGCKVKNADPGGNYLKLIKNVYGLCDASLTWHNHLKKGLISRGFKQSEVDPCLFIKGQTILILHVDDACLCGPNKREIQDIIKSLQKDFDMTDEGDLKD